MITWRIRQIIVQAHAAPTIQTWTIGIRDTNTIGPCCTIALALQNFFIFVGIRAVIIYSGIYTIFICCFQRPQVIFCNKVRYFIIFNQFEEVRLLYAWLILNKIELPDSKSLEPILIVWIFAFDKCIPIRNNRNFIIPIASSILINHLWMIKSRLKDSWD